MRLFSEKVVPTFTSSNLNILTVEDFQEIFFDVFEFEINGKKFIAEKVSDYKGLPVVDVPLVLEGKEFTSPFVLQRGRFEILFNKNNSTFVKDVVEEQQEPIFEYKDAGNEVEEIIFEKKEDILNEIVQARQSAEKYVEKLRQQKINEATLYFDEKKKALDAEINESKKGLLDEFLSLVESVKGEFFEFNEKEREKLSTFIESSISELADQLVESIEEKQDVAVKRFNDRLNELATNILSGVLLKEINSNNDKSTKDINERFETISSSLKKIANGEVKQLQETISRKLDEYDNSILGLEKTSIELNDLINKGDNRALSRIGNVKSQLEESLVSTKNELTNLINEADNKLTEDILGKINIAETNVTDFCNTKIETAENKIKSFYDEKIALVEEKVVDLTAENKQYFVNLINESKLSLLNEISNIKVDVPNIVVERSNGKQEVDLKGIKSELEKIIGTRFSNELQSLKRLIEMSSGGGSVAKQFAAGGTMEGTLNVTGQYLSGGVDLLTIFAGGSDDIEVNTLVRANSGNWDSAYTTGTVYQVNSASYATIDFTNSKFFPLTGGTITGATVINNNLTVNGNLTATGTTTFNNTIFSVTSALSVVHVGAGPAVWVGNSGLGDIASFNDIDTGLEVLHIGGSNGSFPNVGVKTSTPNKTLTVSVEISATSDITTSGKIYIQNDGNSDQWNSAYNLVSGNNLVYTTGDQTISGSKVFDTAPTFSNDEVKGIFITDTLGATDTISNSNLVMRSSFGYSEFSSVASYDGIYKANYNSNYINLTIDGDPPDSYTYNFPQANGTLALDSTAVMLVGNQTIAGNKTFLQNIVGNGIDNRLPNQQLNSSDAILTLKVFEDKLDWNYLPFSSSQSLLSGSATNATAVGSISQDTSSTAGTNYAFIRQSGPFNRSPLSWIGSTSTDSSFFIPFASKRTKIKANLNIINLNSNAFIWFGIWEKTAVPLTVLDNRGFGAKITPTSIVAEVHDGTTLTTGASSVFTDTGSFDLEVDYYQRFCTVRKNGTIVATVSGGYNINATASLIFYAYAVNGTTDRSRVEYKNLRYKITDS